MPLVAELIVFPDPEQVLVDQLNIDLAASEAFATAKAGTRLPNPLEHPFVKVLVVGGTERNLVTDEPTVVLENYGPDEGVASDLAAFTRALMGRYGRLGWIGEIPCLEVRTIGRPQNLPDPVADAIRYSATYALALRGSAV